MECGNPVNERKLQLCSVNIGLAHRSAYDEGQKWQMLGKNHMFNNHGNHTCFVCSQILIAGILMQIKMKPIGSRIHSGLLPRIQPDKPDPDGYPRYSFRPG